MYSVCRVTNHLKLLYMIFTVWQSIKIDVLQPLSHYPFLTKTHKHSMRICEFFTLIYNVQCVHQIILKLQYIHNNYSVAKYIERSFTANISLQQTMQHSRICVFFATIYIIHNTQQIIYSRVVIWFFFLISKAFLL